MQVDLTKERPIKALLLFSLPMLAGNIFQQFYNMVDLIVVGKFVGVNALASVGATASVMFFLFSLVIGLSNGISVLISQYYGAEDIASVRKVVANSIYILAGATVFLTVVGVGFSPIFLRFLNTPESIIGGSITYLQIIFIGAFALISYNGSASIIRALGDSVTPLIFLVVGTVLNIGLDLLFVITFGMGVAGAAWATVISQATAAGLCILYAVKKMPILRLSKADFVFDKGIFTQCIKIGLPSSLQNSIVAIGSMIMQFSVNSFGPSLVAAFSAVTKLEQVIIQPLITLGMASATFTAQNIGAGQLERVKKGLHSAIIIMLVFCGITAATIFTFGEQLILMFVNVEETSVITAGVEYLRLVSLFYVVLGLVIIMESMLRGAGDVLFTAFSCGVEVVARTVALLTLPLVLGYIGVWWSSPITWIAGTIVCFIRYKTGIWKSKSIVKN